eukprot:s1973_g6.t1
MQLLVRDFSGQIILEMTLRGGLPLEDLSRRVREAKPTWMGCGIRFLCNEMMLESNDEFQDALGSESDLELTAVAEERPSSEEVLREQTFEEVLGACQEILLGRLGHAHGGSVSLDYSFTHDT